MMNSAPPSGHSESQSTTRPPLFDGSHFICWKTRMEMFIQGEDYELWDRITDGPSIPMKLVDGEQVKKVRSEFTVDDLVALKKNTKAKNILFCGLGPAEYNIVSNCTTAKQIWDALVNAHEGTSQVRKFRIVILFTEYEDFKMKENKSLQEIMTRLTALTNELTSLEKVITVEEQVEKVLRVLPKSK
ncbi:hypothetical protein FXO38_36932 [Capsicum annuum]|nr:hypothetical protein FXO38_36932 [Capsicum annuum]